MNIPKILEDVLGRCDWHGVNPKDVTDEQLLDWAEEIEFGIMVDYDTYIDDEVWHDRDFDELRKFVENKKKEIEK